MQRWVALNAPFLLAAFRSFKPLPRLRLGIGMILICLPGIWVSSLFGEIDCTFCWRWELVLSCETGVAEIRLETQPRQYGYPSASCRRWPKSLAWNDITWFRSPRELLRFMRVSIHRVYIPAIPPSPAFYRRPSTLRMCMAIPSMAHRYFEIIFPVWIPVLLTLILCRSLLRHDRWHLSEAACRRCGYNLTGNISGICPECGTPTPQSTEPAPMIA